MLFGNGLYWTFTPLKYAIHNTNSILKGLILCNVSPSSYPIDLNVTIGLLSFPVNGVFRLITFTSLPKAWVLERLLGTSQRDLDKYASGLLAQCREKAFLRKEHWRYE